jgi:8-oxo-dGTP pyrophosphatase MutT (NUDIX family)
MQKFIQSLRHRMDLPLPGERAQKKMISRQLGGNDSNSRFKIPEQHKKASVLVLFYPKNTSWNLALMQRPESPYAHSKQVSFPGGGAEEHDLDEAETALRETEEEFGIPKSSINLIGRLTHVYIPVSNYLVHPFIGYLTEEPIFIPDANEVEEIVEVPLEELINPANRKIKEIEIQGGIKLQDVPYFDLSEKVIWGATAMMLGELTELLEELDY